MKYLYKYPLHEFPYSQLVSENQKRSAQDKEYELADTGIFDDHHYVDIVIEYAKATEEDTCVKLEIFNRSEKEAVLDVLPQLFFRNRWSCDPNRMGVPTITVGPASPKSYASLIVDPRAEAPPDVLTKEYILQPCYFYGSEPSELLFTNNETNYEKLFKRQIHLLM